MYELAAGGRTIIEQHAGRIDHILSDKKLILGNLPKN